MRRGWGVQKGEYEQTRKEVMVSSIESTNCTQASERNRRPLIIAEKRDHLQRN